jgi:hypothetical protein
MSESMRRAQVIGDAPASRVRATGLGSPRNGLPDIGGYHHPGWVNGVPSPADNPTDPRERAEAARQGRLRKITERDLAAEGRCSDCSYPLGSYGHGVACGGGS